MSGRIVTLTLNPAVDLACTAERVERDHKIRTRGEHYDPGGGGVNVARVVHDLGGDAVAVVLLGGRTGDLYEELLAEHGVPYHVLRVEGRTRIALNVAESATGAEYRFVPEGPELEAGDADRVLELLDRTPCEFLVGSGSLPRGVPADFYARVARRAAASGRRFVLDSSGEALRLAMGEGVALCKPSRREFASLLGRESLDAASLEREALAMVRDGAAEMLVISLGIEGALLATRDGVTRARVPEVGTHGAAGAGDSLVGAMTWSLARGDAPDVAFRWGMAAAAAATHAAGTAHAAPSLVRTLFAKSVT